jgi:YegS/Rv2252/BmrU family lipid kinase
MQINAKLYSWQIILNPNAFLHRSNRFWKDIENKLQEVQIKYHHHETSTIDEAYELITTLCKKGERHFMIAGGDGTLNIFANAVMKSQVNSSEIYAAFIPLGTGNDWSRSHGYSGSYLDAIDALVNGNFMSHDLGLVETVVNDEVIDARYFVNIAGFGFDGAVISNASKTTSKFLHKQLYLINLLKTLLSYKSQLVTLKSNDSTVIKNIFTIAAGIGQYNGNGMRQCPEAISNDGLFDVVMIEKVSVIKVLLNIKNLFEGAHVKKLKEVSMMRTNYLEINTEPFIPGEVEGELLTAGNYRIRCLESAMNMMSMNF